MRFRTIMVQRIDFRRAITTAVIVTIAGLVIVVIGLRNGVQAFQEARTGEAQSEPAKEAPPLSRENPPRPETFKPMRVLPRMKPITDVPIVSSADAAQSIDDDELVLGITINGKSRAYPLNMLNGPFREIFNDELGGKAIAATW